MQSATVSASVGWRPHPGQNKPGFGLCQLTALPLGSLSSKGGVQVGDAQEPSEAQLGAGVAQGQTRRDPRGKWGRTAVRGLPDAWEAPGPRSPQDSPSACLPFQFDLQRIVIYCDSRHAELETCCDIPSGPVSKALAWRGWVETGA